jgi:hypothetical protein
MPSAKKPPVSDLSALLKNLNEAGIRFIVVGGLAAVVQGVPITTFDLDIVPDQSADNIKRLIKFLKSVDAYQRRPDDKVIEPDEKDLMGKGHLLLNTKFGPLDILAVIEMELNYHELLPSSIEIDYKGHKTFVLSLEAIVRLKEDTTDPNERYRLKIYKETLRLKSKNQ